MAKVRSLGLLPTSLATRALAITFQSVTTSARADAANSAAATMPGSKLAAAGLKTDLIGRLLFCCPRMECRFTPGGCGHFVPFPFHSCVSCLTCGVRQLHAEPATGWP